MAIHCHTVFTKMILWIIYMYILDSKYSCLLYRTQKREVPLTSSLARLGHLMTLRAHHHHVDTIFLCSE